MLDVDLSREEADAIYEVPKYIDSNAVSWEMTEGNSQRINISLITEDGTPLRIRGWYSWGGSMRYGFSLLFKNSIVIRRWDNKLGHKDSVTKSIAKGPHKHYHDPSYADSRCYETSDVRTGDVNGALFDFMKECHISVEGIDYQALGEYHGV